MKPPGTDVDTFLFAFDAIGTQWRSRQTSRWTVGWSGA